jgi:hypothetical protein
MRSLRKRLLVFRLREIRGCLSSENLSVRGLDLGSTCKTYKDFVTTFYIQTDHVSVIHEKETCTAEREYLLFGLVVSLPCM